MSIHQTGFQTTIVQSNMSLTTDNLHSRLIEILFFFDKGSLRFERTKIREVSEDEALQIEH